MKNRTKFALTAVSGIVSAPVSYATQRTLGAWGALDSISDVAGRNLKIHLTPEHVGWTIAVLIVLISWALALHFILKVMDIKTLKRRQPVVGPEVERNFSFGIVVKGKNVTVTNCGSYGNDTGIHVDATEIAKVENSLSVGSGTTLALTPSSYRPGIPPDIL